MKKIIKLFAPACYIPCQHVCHHREGKKAVYLKKYIKIRMDKSTLGMTLKISVLLANGICLLSRCMHWMANVFNKSSMEYFHWPTITHSDFLGISSLYNGYL